MAASSHQRASNRMDREDWQPNAAEDGVILKPELVQGNDGEHTILPSFSSLGLPSHVDEQDAAPSGTSQPSNEPPIFVGSDSSSHLAHPLAGMQGDMPLPEARTTQTLSTDVPIRFKAYPSKPLPHPYASSLSDLGWVEPLRWQYYRGNPPNCVTGLKTRAARVRALHGHEGWPLPLPYERWREFRSRQNRLPSAADIERMKSQFRWRAQYDASLMGADGGVIPGDEQADAGHTALPHAPWDDTSQSSIVIDSPPLRMNFTCPRNQPEASTASQIERAPQPPLQYHMPLPTPRRSPTAKVAFFESITAASYDNPPEQHQYATQLTSLGWSEPLLWQYYRANPPADSKVRMARVALISNSLYRDWPLPHPYELQPHYLTRLGASMDDPIHLAELKLQFSWREKFDPRLDWEGCEAWFV